LLGKRYWADLDIPENIHIETKIGSVIQRTQTKTVSSFFGDDKMYNVTAAANILIITICGMRTTVYIPWYRIEKLAVIKQLRNSVPT
jgi:hypothetical protein